MKAITIVLPDALDDRDIYYAMGAGAEEVALHADKPPGREGCGDKICTKQSHREMSRWANILTLIETELERELEP